MSSPDIAKNAIVILRSNINTIIINAGITNSNWNDQRRVLLCYGALEIVSVIIIIISERML